jgi:metal-sulfur cluster biosynthetic enzyme
MVNKKQIEKILKTVNDPELNISVVSIGLIYKITVDTQGNVTILMTLTSIGCPLFDLIAQDIREKVKTVKGVRSVSIDLTFEPVWTPDKMSKEAKAQLGL